MKPLRDFLTEEQIKDLASRSYFRYGKEIASDGDVKIIKQNTFNVLATVHNGQARTVELTSTPKGFRYKCTCTNKKNLFCQHCVAVGLFMSNQE